MTTIMTILFGLALAFAYSPSFAEETAGKGTGQGQQVKTESKSPAQTKGPEAAVKAKATKAALRKVAADELGKDAVCPVTGEKFKVTAETVSASYKGKVYYFCCPGCTKPFLANPGKYLNTKKPDQARKAACPDEAQKK